MSAYDFDNVIFVKKELMLAKLLMTGIKRIILPVNYTMISMVYFLEISVKIIQVHSTHMLAYVK